MLRRSLFVFSSFVLIDEPCLQVQTLITISLAYMVYLNLAVDYVDPSAKKFEIVNEGFFLLSCYIFMLFTISGSIPASQRGQLGISLLCLIGLLLAFNYSIIVRANVLKLCRSLFLRKLKKR